MSPQSFDQFLDLFYNPDVYGDILGNEVLGVGGGVGAPYRATFTGQSSSSSSYRQLDSPPVPSSTRHGPVTSVSEFTAVQASPAIVSSVVCPPPAVVKDFPTTDFSNKYFADIGTQAPLYQDPFADLVSYSSSLLTEHPSTSALDIGSLHYGSAPQGTFNGELEQSPAALFPKTQHGHAIESDNLDDLWEYCFNGANSAAPMQRTPCWTPGSSVVEPARVVLEAPRFLAHSPRDKQHNFEHIDLPPATAQIPTPNLTPEQLNFPPVSGSAPASLYHAGGFSMGPVQYETGMMFPTDYRGSVGPVGWAPETETQLTQQAKSTETVDREYSPPAYPPPNFNPLVIGSAATGRPDALPFIGYRGPTEYPLRTQKSHSQRRAAKRPAKRTSSPVTPVRLVAPDRHFQQAHLYPLDPSIHSHACLAGSIPASTSKRRREDDESAGPSKRSRLSRAMPAPASSLHPSLARRTSTSTLSRRPRSSAYDSQHAAGPSNITPPTPGPSAAPAAPDVQFPTIMIGERLRFICPAEYAKKISDQQPSNAEEGSPRDLTGYLVELRDAVEHEFKRPNKGFDALFLCSVGNCNSALRDYERALFHIAAHVHKEKARAASMQKMRTEDGNLEDGRAESAHAGVQEASTAIAAEGEGRKRQVSHQS
ncbi:hypothetical protein K488DRAFT_70858 [Vararia minispora EC-137]|uniref:Uncharacterized protein n=1 Tax=Vararia minispora EC-137 TaxID=1314806 RepID=A0ACB8QKH5_9AGAM|nr:hypothetical protein K488DRAFT_70858 [Vararia minispora EC-137]